MNVNDGKWFRSLGAEKLMEAEEREREVKDMSEIKETTLLEAVPSDTVIVDKCTGEKMILLGFTTDDEYLDFAITADKYGDIHTRKILHITVLLTEEQKKLLE